MRGWETEEGKIKGVRIGKMIEGKRKEWITVRLEIGVRRDSGREGGR